MMQSEATGSHEASNSCSCAANRSACREAATDALQDALQYLPHRIIYNVSNAPCALAGMLHSLTELSSNAIVHICSPAA